MKCEGILELSRVGVRYRDHGLLAYTTGDYGYDSSPRNYSINPRIPVLSSILSDVGVPLVPSYCSSFQDRYSKARLGPKWPLMHASNFICSYFRPKLIDAACVVQLLRSRRPASARSGGWPVVSRCIRFAVPHPRLERAVVVYATKKGVGIRDGRMIIKNARPQ